MDDEGGRGVREVGMYSYISGMSLGSILEVELMGPADVWNVADKEVSCGSVRPIEYAISRSMMI